MSKKVQTYEDHAKMFEDILTGLAASDAKLGRDFTAHMLGYTSAIKAAKEEMSHYGVVTDEISGLVPPSISMVFGGEDQQDLFKLITVKRLGVLANRRYGLGLLGDQKRCVVEQMTIRNSGSVINHPSIYFQMSSGTWMPSNPKFSKVTSTKNVSSFSNRGSKWTEYEQVESTISPYPEMAAVSEWSRRMCWGIRFSAIEAPGLVAATDPIGVRELLRMRDVSEGRNRREALLHWVKEHWRKNRKDEAIEHQVRQHLRGQEKCQWFGLECQIIPSKIDAAKDMLASEKKWRTKAADGKWTNVIINGTRVS